MALDFSDVSYISSEDHKKISARSRVDCGDILFAMIGTIGNPVIVACQTDFSIKNVALFKFAGTQVSNRYFKHLLSSKQVLRQLEAVSRGGTQKFVSLSALRDLRIPLPPLPEQRRIAAILDQADALRTKRRHASKYLEGMTSALFNEMFGTYKEILHRWPVRLLGDLLDFLTSGSRGWAEYYADSGDLFLRIQNVGRDELRLHDLAYVNAPDSAEARRTRVRPGDVLLSSTADLGRTALVPAEFGTAFINQHLCLLRTTQLDPKYLSAY